MGNVWNGLQNSDMEEINALIGVSLGVSPTKASKQQRAKRIHGIVAHFNDERGWGFINAGKSRLFFHISECSDYDSAIVPVGSRVTFETGEDKKGRECAVSIKVFE
ncbi:cold shock domain-containing protein [Paenibacillus sp. FSL R5-0713]|uniref:cold-shock protein n=1 Tax=Paenibacillus sp. FSL R5-0713 TaxID=2921655 RepID=UPI0030D933C2